MTRPGKPRTLPPPPPLADEIVELLRRRGLFDDTRPEVAAQLLRHLADLLCQAAAELETGKVII